MLFFDFLNKNKRSENTDNIKDNNIKDNNTNDKNIGANTLNNDTPPLEVDFLTVFLHPLLYADLEKLYQYILSLKEETHNFEQLASGDSFLEFVEIVQNTFVKLGVIVDRTILDDESKFYKSVYFSVPKYDETMKFNPKLVANCYKSFLIEIQKKALNNDEKIVETKTFVKYRNEIWTVKKFLEKERLLELAKLFK